VVSQEHTRVFAGRGAEAVHGPYSRPVELLVVLLPVVSALTLCAWRGAPRVLPLGFAAASSSLALGLLGRGLAGGAGWPWPLPVRVDVPLPGSDGGPEGWISLTTWGPGICGAPPPWS
jgi:hypothetical protein